MPTQHPSSLFVIPPVVKPVFRHEFLSVLTGSLFVHKLASFVEQVDGRVVHIRDNSIRLVIGSRGPFRWLRNNQRFPVLLDVETHADLRDPAVHRVSTTLRPLAIGTNSELRRHRYETLIRELHSCLMVHREVTTAY